MEIINQLHQKFHSNKTIHHSLIESATDGTMSCGFLKKNTLQGSHVNFTFDFFSALLVVSGEGYYEDSHFKSVIKPGDFIMRFPNNPHTTLVTSNDWEELYLCFGTPLFNTLVSLNVLSTKKPVLHPGIDYHLIDDFITLFDKLNSASHVDLPSILPSMIELVTTAIDLDRKMTYSLAETELLESSIHYIQTHLQKRVSLEEVAASINMGYEKYRKLFLKHYGTSPGNYMIQQRIKHAQQLLTQSSLTVKEIGFNLGYPDAYTFSKQFKKVTGMAPYQFRTFLTQSSK